LQRNAISE